MKLSKQKFTLARFEDNLPRWSMLTFLALFVIAQWMTQRHGGRLLSGVYKIWLGLACLQAASVGWRAATMFVRGKVVLETRCVPSPLKQGWHSQVARDGARPLLLLSALSVILLAYPESPWAWYTGVVWILFFALAALALALHGNGALRLVRAQAGSGAGHQESVSGWHQLVVAQLRRYSTLGDASSQSEGHLMRRSRGTWVKFYLLPLVPLGFLPGWAMSFSWGGPISTLHILGLWLGAFSFAGLLLFRDLTWRYFLLPGGHKRDALGRHIFLSTLPYPVLVWVPAVLFFCAAKAMSLDQNLLGVVSELLWQPKAGIVLAEVFLVFSLAVLTRSLGAWWQALCMAAIVVLGGACVVTYGFDTPALITAGPTYIAILLTVTVAAILLADRVWTTRKLMPQML